MYSLYLQNIIYIKKPTPYMMMPSSTKYFHNTNNWTENFKLSFFTDSFHIFWNRSVCTLKNALENCMCMENLFFVSSSSCRYYHKTCTVKHYSVIIVSELQQLFWVPSRTQIFFHHFLQTMYPLVGLFVSVFQTVLNTYRTFIPIVYSYLT